MSNQQLALVVITGLLAFLAVPGVVMGPPDTQQAKQTETQPTSSSESDVTNSSESSEPPKTTQPTSTGSESAPNTSLKIDRTTQDEREQIQYERKININKANRDNLQGIPRVGPATADKIISFREAGNKFYSTKELTKISGIGDRTIERLKPFITVGKEMQNRSRSNTTSKIDINSASADQLTQLSGIGDVTANSIIDYRDSNGPFRSVDGLDNVDGIGPATIDKIRDQVTY